jgi:isopenicillin N synthase-like dioxygenase
MRQVTVYQLLFKTGLNYSAINFFALPEKEKMQIAMHKAGKAWRGYFPLNSELTSGKPDLKEGIYFGTELGQDDTRVQQGASFAWR